MGFQYTQLETFSHSTSLENLLNYEDGYVFAPAYWHPLTHPPEGKEKQKNKKKKKKKRRGKKKTENEENKRKLARRGSREEAAAAFATAAVS